MTIEKASCFTCGKSFERVFLFKDKGRRKRYATPEGRKIQGNRCYPCFQQKHYESEAGSRRRKRNEKQQMELKQKFIKKGEKPCWCEVKVPDSNGMASI